jgi:hypothetical protein
MHSKRIGKRPSTGAALYSPQHFNLTVEIPLKAVVRGYTWKSLPITWRNRRSGEAKLQDQGNGQRLSAYLFEHLARKISGSRTLSSVPIENF